MARRLSSCGLQALECRLSSCGARAQLPLGMWDLPRPGLEPVSPELAGGFLTTASPGKSKTGWFLGSNLWKKLSNLKQAGEGPMSTDIYAALEYLPAGYLLITKGKRVTSQLETSPLPVMGQNASSASR